jgi:tetratricopeptide (TPR) repeat protein
LLGSVRYGPGHRIAASAAACLMSRLHSMICWSGLAQTPQIALARRAVFVLAPAKCFRGVAWLSHGALAEAEANLRDALWAVTTTSQRVGTPVIAAYLADTLMEQGNLEEAEAVLDRASTPEPLPRAGYWAWLLGSRARLLALQGRVPEALQTWLACGRRFAAHGGRNPAVLAWRSGAALAMHRLGRSDEARQLASEEVTLARRWGAPTALGRALRVAGLVAGDHNGLAPLMEATTVLTASPARLEQAKTFIDTGGCTASLRPARGVAPVPATWPRAGSDLRCYATHRTREDGTSCQRRPAATHRAIWTRRTHPA